MSNAKAQIERAIHQIQDKGPVPEIDYTQHQLEDGNTISTQERVVKDVRQLAFISFLSFLLLTGWLLTDDWTEIGSSACYEHTNRGAILFARGSFETRCCIPQEPFLPGRPPERGAGDVYFGRSD
jgi:hypothetical protein